MCCELVSGNKNNGVVKKVLTSQQPFKSQKNKLHSQYQNWHACRHYEGFHTNLKVFGLTPIILCKC